jgi:Tol biopolymer transport system component
MTSERRLEQDLPALLERLAQPSMPDYRDHIVQQTARTRQRPAWMVPERLLPMTAITRRIAFAPRVPQRAAILVALLLVARVVGLLLTGGPSQRLPAPFGVAANGLIAYAAGGDIFTVDPVTGAPIAVVTGPETDRAPVWSRDGTHLAFFRTTGLATSSTGQLHVARSDGRELIVITPDPIAVTPDLLEGVFAHSFSPDGREVTFTTESGGTDQLWIAKADGSGVRPLAVGMDAWDPTYLPPDGVEIAFAAGGLAEGIGLYAVNVATGVVRVIVAPTPGVERGATRPSPDGSRLAYVASTDMPGQNSYVVHVVATDGTGRDVTLPLPDGAFFQDLPVWSNDGTRLAITRGYAPYDQDMVLAIVPADGSGIGIETERRITACCANAYEWAPDDSVILMTPIGFGGAQLPLQQILIDPVTGASRPAPWVATSAPAWQRRAP